MTYPAPKGFTLIELLVVISILAILSVIGLTSYMGVTSRARDAQRIDDARKLITALEQYRSSASYYPSVAQSATWGNLNAISSSGGGTWIANLDTSNFRDNTLPKDPKNSGRLVYWYISLSSNSSDYCLQIPQENDVTGHPYYRGRWASGGGNAVSGDPWQLRFGPNGANNGLCGSTANTSP